MDYSTRLNLIRSSFQGTSTDTPLNAVKSPQDAVALAVHAAALEKGLKLSEVNGQDAKGSSRKYIQTCLSIALLDETTDHSMGLTPRT